MAQVINTNTMSLVTRNNLNKSQGVLGTAIERLSSGLRINTAKDDAAGQAIANRFSSQIRGLTQASRNANDGISIAQTAEGALSEINTNVQRIRELTVQALNGTYSAGDLTSIQNEIDQRISEINRISDQTDFNGVKVLQGKGATEANLGSRDPNVINIQVGANDGEVITFNLGEINASSLHIDKFNIDPTKKDSAGATMPKTDDPLKTIDGALNQIDKARGELGALQNRFESTVNNLNNTSNNLSAARSRIEDADYAEEVSNMTRGQILQQAGTSVLAQANQVPQSVLSLLQ